MIGRLAGGRVPQSLADGRQFPDLFVDRIRTIRQQLTIDLRTATHRQHLPDLVEQVLACVAEIEYITCMPVVNLEHDDDDLDFLLELAA